MKMYEYFIETHSHPCLPKFHRKEDILIFKIRKDQIGNDNINVYRYLTDNELQAWGKQKHLTSSNTRWVMDAFYRINQESKNRYVLSVKYNAYNNSYDPVYYLKEMTETDKIVEFI